jgi:glycine C-acetyltransferase
MGQSLRLATISTTYVQRDMNVRQASSSPALRFEGAAEQFPVIDFSTNDYLGLSRDVDVRRAATDAIDEQGAGGRTVRRVGRESLLEQSLEAAIAEFEDSEAVVVTQSGYMANTSLIPSISNTTGLLIYDAYAHPSIVDGGLLSGAECLAYKHLDLHHLERLLARCRKSGPTRRPVVVTTDGVFGTDGEIAPVPAIIELAERFDATVVVDDAHATGVLGETGRGTTEHFGVSSESVIKTGTLSKALGAAGGFIASSSRVKQGVLRKGHAVLYSTVAPPSTLAAALAAITKLRAEPERLRRLRGNTISFRSRLAGAGFRIGASEAAIIAIFGPSVASVQEAERRLRADGILVRSVLPPRVRREDACLRVMMSSAHTLDELERGAESIARIGAAVGFVR